MVTRLVKKIKGSKNWEGKSVDLEIIQKEDKRIKEEKKAWGV